MWGCGEICVRFASPITPRECTNIGGGWRCRTQIGSDETFRVPRCDTFSSFRTHGGDALRVTTMRGKAPEEHYGSVVEKIKLHWGFYPNMLPLAYAQ